MILPRGRVSARDLVPRAPRIVLPKDPRRTTGPFSSPNVPDPVFRSGTYWAARGAMVGVTMAEPFGVTTRLDDASGREQAVVATARTGIHIPCS